MSGSGDARGAALDAVIAEADEILPRHGLTHLDVCSCGVCMSLDLQAAVARMDRTEIPEAAMADWFGAAKGDDGRVSVPVAEHLGPRILRLIRDDSDIHGIERAFDACAFGDRTRWTGRQAALLDRAATAILDLYRGDAPRGEMLDDTLCMLARGRYDVAPLLSAIEAWPDRDIVQRLWRDWVGWCQMPMVWRTAFWDDPLVEDARLATADWYAGPALRAAVDRFLETTPTDDPDWDRAAGVEAALAAYAPPSSR